MHARAPRADLAVPLFSTYRFRQRIHVTLAGGAFAQRRWWQRHLSAFRGDARIFKNHGTGKRADYNYVDYVDDLDESHTGDLLV